MSKYGAIVALGAVMALGPTAITTAEASREEATSTMQTRIDDRISQLGRELVTSPRMGAFERQAIRSDLRGLKSARSRIEAGESIAASELAELLGRDDRVRRVESPEAIERRLARQREARERRLAVNVPKLGAVERSRLRADLSELDSLIADLERGDDVDIARVDRLIGLMRASAPRTPDEKLRDLEVERAVKTRKLGPGPRMGAVERSRIRDEINALDAMIEELESRP